MKCSECNGTGKSKYGYNQPCTHCYGKGFTEPQTNDEWRRTCSTEEFAEWLTFKRKLIRIPETNYEVWMNWLKEIHQ